MLEVQYAKGNPSNVAATPSLVNGIQSYWNCNDSKNEGIAQIQITKIKILHNTPPKKKKGGLRKSKVAKQFLFQCLMGPYRVLLVPRLRPSSRSLRSFPWASVLLHRPCTCDICLDLLPAAPLPPVQKRVALHKFLHQSSYPAEVRSENFLRFSLPRAS